MSRELIAFYSRADENYLNGMLKVLTVGNTEVVAKNIQKVTGADMFKIEQMKPYSKGYNDCIQEARVDQQIDARPELVEYPKSIDKYDVIYLGFPNYWSTMPMAVFTFLERLDFSGKRIRPFCTHEGSGIGSSVADIKKACPRAIVEEAMAILGGRVNDSMKYIESWVK